MTGAARPTVLRHLYRKGDPTTMSTPKTNRYRNIIRPDQPPPIAVQGVACSIVQGGLVAAQLFSEYPQMPKDVTLRVPSPGEAVESKSTRITREFSAVVMMTPETALSIARGLVDAARQIQSQATPPLAIEEGS